MTIQLETDARSATVRRSRLRTTFLMSASVSAVAAAALTLPGLALAQGPAANEIDTVVVTASRIARDGFQAPTPVSVIDGEELAKRGLSSVGDLLNQVPSFRASQSPSQNTSTATGAGYVFADLRGIGSQRTLVLVDGRRHVPSASTGQVDLNLVPAIMLDRAEVVTGGASAAWGSDAVAGVVNLMIKKNLQGMIGELSTGVSEQGDNKEIRVALASGTIFAGARGRIVGGFEYVNNKGVGDSTQRDWARQDYGIATNPTPGVNGLPARIIGPNFYQAALTGGGIVTTGPLRGTIFQPGGAVGQMQYGQVFGTGMFGPGTTGLTQQIGVLWKVPVERFSGLVNVDYDLTDRISAFVQAGYAQSGTKNVNGYPRDAALTVRRDNAYLPASVLQSMIANNLQTLTVGRYDFDLPAVRPENESKTKRIVVGVSGKLGNTWIWKTYLQYGRNNYRVDIPNNRVNANWQAAIDAVSVNGTIVCRNPNLVLNGVTASPGCVPFNIFGQGSASPAAVAYVVRDGWGDTTVTQTVAAFDVTGEVFSTWAGPVSLALGADYRKETANSTSDPLSQASAFNIGNPRPLHGRFDVKEVYGETVIPLASDLPLAKSLELNAAARHSDYSVSGAVTTWKLGLTYALIDGVRFRGTRSRDIRAPNINELYGQSLFSQPVIINRWTGVGVNTIINNGIGNPNLSPERAETETYGVVLQPTFLPKLKLSIDYYKIDMEDQITTLGAQVLVDRCYAGAKEFCPFVVGAGTSTITRVDNANLNLNRFRTSGIDFEISYATPLSEIASSLPGDLSVHLLATNVKELTTIDTVNAINRVGQLGAAGGVPEWTFDGQVSYRLNALSLTANIHRIDAGKYDATLLGPGEIGFNPFSANSINDNKVDGVTYVGLTARYDLLQSDKRSVQVFGSVSNLFNQDPSPSPTGATVMNGAFFDPVGRSFTLGIRFKM